ncbi:MAG: TerB family tellurite resistance protein [Myxococcales bacterium]|nr:TerB family tellurite resistance protein [Myxococcales bacterium]
MIRDKLIQSLHHLGINRNNFRVLKLLPLIYVAWADGKMDGVQKERIVALAHDHFAIGAGGEAVLRRWLERPLTKAQFLEGLHEIFVLAHAPDEWEFDLDELQGLLVHAEAIARATAEAMGHGPTSVSPASERALADIARALQIDTGESWARLMAELTDDEPYEDFGDDERSRVQLTAAARGGAEESGAVGLFARGRG